VCLEQAAAGDAETLKISPLDARVIELLQQDARMPILHIAKQLGVPEATVRRRVNRLVSSGVLQFAAWVNPPELPDHVWALIDLQVDMRRVDEIANELAKIDAIYFVAISSGPFELQATAVFSSNEDMLAFLRGPLSTIPGIERVNTSTVVKLVKRKPMYIVPWGALTEPSKS
jgi:Lrp/AsnC family transcriptional regulator for asnA, asnC and gidA